MLANSAYLLLSTITSGAFGFVFWILASHLYRPRQIGLATTLVVASTLISYASQLGFNSTFIRFLPSARDHSDEINTGLILVLLASVVLAVGYILVVPILVPELRVIRDSPALAGMFVVFCVVSSLNLATDSVFIAFRRAHFNLLTDGVILGTAKVVLPVFLVGLGGFGVYAATGVAATVAVGASLALLAWRLDYRPRLRVSMAYLRRAMTFSAANYTANLLNMVPILVLPLVVINRLGATSAGFFYIAFQLANLTFAVAYAVSQSAFAEGSQPGASFRQVVRRSAALEVVAIGPAVLGMAVLGHEVLGVFGSAYSRHAESTLVALAVSAPVVAAYDWVCVVLRLRRALAQLVVVNVVYAGGTAVFALLWAHLGTAWVGLAWLTGNVLAAAVGLVFATLHRPGWRPIGDRGLELEVVAADSAAA